MSTFAEVLGWVFMGFGGMTLVVALLCWPVITVADWLFRDREKESDHRRTRQEDADHD